MVGHRKLYFQLGTFRIAYLVPRLGSNRPLAFVDDILRRRIFDGERLSELMAPLNLGWKARTQKELALVKDLTPLLHKLSQGREIAGLAAYEEGR